MTSLFDSARTFQFELVLNRLIRRFSLFELATSAAIIVYELFIYAVVNLKRGNGPFLINAAHLNSH